MTTLVLNTKDSSSSVLTLNTQISGSFELIHQWVDYHTTDAIDYRSDQIKLEKAGTLDVDIDLTDSETLDVDQIVTDIQLALDVGIPSGTATKVGTDQIRIDATQDLEFDWVNSSARVLFYQVSGVQTISSGQSYTFTLKDRTNIKHYSIFITEAFQGLICSDGSEPTLLVSSFDDQALEQVMKLRGEVETLNFTIREYGGIVDFLEEDIPDIHMIFKKKDSVAKKRQVYLNSSDLSVTSNQFALSTNIEGEFEVIYSHFDPFTLDIIGSEGNVLVTSLGTVTFTVQDTFDPDQIKTDLETQLSVVIIQTDDGEGTYTYTLDSGTFTIFWDDPLSTFGVLLRESGTEITNNIQINLNELPEETPSMVNVSFDETRSILITSSEDASSLVVPTEDSDASGQELTLNTETDTLTPTLARAHWPTLPVTIDSEWTLILEQSG